MRASSLPGAILAKWTRRCVTIVFAGAAIASQCAHLQVAEAASVPFTDPHANGSMTLCGRNGQPVTSGSLLTQPFVWKVVSSSAAPRGYTRAYLTLFQPIQHVDPSHWTGYDLTSVSVFDDHNHPTVQATNLDPALTEPDYQIPPYWDGLYELRIFFTGLDEPGYSLTYPVAVIRVTGNSWQLVSGGNVPCSAGAATSEEEQAANPRALSTPQTIGVTGPGPTASSKTSGSASSASTNTHGTSSATTTTGSGGEVAAGDTPSRGSAKRSPGTPATLIFGLTAGALVLAAALAAVLRRRRKSEPSRTV